MSSDDNAQLSRCQSSPEHVNSEYSCDNERNVLNNTFHITSNFDHSSQGKMVMDQKIELFI